MQFKKLDKFRLGYIDSRSQVSTAISFRFVVTFDCLPGVLCYLAVNILSQSTGWFNEEVDSIQINVRKTSFVPKNYWIKQFEYISTFRHRNFYMSQCKWTPTL